MSERKTFLFYAEWKEIIQNYPTELRIELYEAIVDYAMGKELDLSPSAKLIFPFIAVKIDAGNKRQDAIAERNRLNGSKGGRKIKKTPKNQKKPVGNLGLENNPEEPKETQKTHSVIKEEKEKRSKKEIEENNAITDVIAKKEEKEINNNIYFQKEEKTFDSVFGKFKEELLGEYQGIWRDTVTQKFGVKNHALALDDFKAHIIAQGKEKNVTEQNISEFKAYFANSARMGFLSDKSKSELKSEPKPTKRKPCVFYTQRTGQGVIGVISQDGKTFYVHQDVGYPPTESHYWNPASKQYEVQQR